MRSIDWKYEVCFLLFLIGAAYIFSLAYGHLFLFLFIAALIYIARFFIQLAKIKHWLSTNAEAEPPKVLGVWGDVLDEIYRLKRISIEEKNRLQAAVNYLRDSFSSLQEGAIMLDPDGNIEWSNAAAARLLNVKYPDDVGEPLIDIVHEQEFIDYFQEGDYSDVLDILSPYRKNIQIEIKITSFGRGNRLLFARDVSRTYKLMKMRKDFIGNVSHELRTPLTVINGYLDTLGEHTDIEPQRLQRVISQMSLQSHRMETLIHDLIMLSRLESVPADADNDAIDVCKMLEKIREEALAAARGKKTITVECVNNVPLMGHYDELRSAFTNLIVNAIKYTEDEGIITVRWHADNNHQYLEVCDNGIGIEPEHIPRLTERFYRVDKSRSTQTGGTGLGLAIVKHILLRHQAQLTISSVPDKGSTFTCVFPRRLYN